MTACPRDSIPLALTHAREAKAQGRFLKEVATIHAEAASIKVPSNSAH